MGWALLSLLLASLWPALLLVALSFVVRAVEGGVRRALREDLLRPSVRDLLADPGSRPRPPAQDEDDG